jgi:hypothetical protein
MGPGTDRADTCGLGSDPNHHMHRVVAAMGGDGDNAMLKDIASFFAPESS